MFHLNENNQYNRSNFSDRFGKIVRELLWGEQAVGSSPCPGDAAGRPQQRCGGGRGDVRWCGVPSSHLWQSGAHCGRAGELPSTPTHTLSTKLFHRRTLHTRQVITGTLYSERPADDILEVVLFYTTTQEQCLTSGVALKSPHEKLKRITQDKRGLWGRGSHHVSFVRSGTQLYCGSSPAPLSPQEGNGSLIDVLNIPLTDLLKVCSAYHQKWW